MTWKELFGNKKQLALTVVTLVALGFTLVSYGNFCTTITQRKGFPFVDPLQNLLPHLGLPWLPASLLAAGAVLFIAVTAAKADVMFKYIRAVVLLLGFRMLVAWMLPLQLPAGGYPVLDCTSLVVLMSLVTTERWLKVTLNLLALVIAYTSLAGQQQYAIEVLLAPLCAIASLRIVTSSDQH